MLTASVTTFWSGGIQNLARLFAAAPSAFFVAPPWGTALDEAKGLDLRRTTPPITEIISQLTAQFPRHKLLFATQVYEKVDGASLAEVQRLLDWTRLRVYGINSTGRNHGIVLGTKGFRPKE